MTDNRIIRAKLAYEGISYKDAAKLCEISEVSFSSKINGRTEWKLAELVALAHRFRCTVDDLLATPEQEGK